VAGFLFDENLPYQLAVGLATCGLDMHAIGDGRAPDRRSSDADNVAWCLENECALVTVDRGKKNPEIKILLARHTNLSLILVPRKMGPRELLYTFVRHHKTMEEEVARAFREGGAYRRRIKREGRLERM
jgi:Domain of unknown function (DUF5615)